MAYPADWIGLNTGTDRRILSPLLFASPPSSFEFWMAGAGNWYGMARANDSAWVSGRIRAKLRARSGTPDQVAFFLLGCMQGTAHTSLCYRLLVSIGSNGIRAQRLAANSTDHTSNIGGGGTMPFTPAVNQWFAVQLEWVYSPTTGNFTIKTYSSTSVLSSPATYDWSDLVVRTSGTDTSQTFSSAVTMGLAAGASNNFDHFATFDDARGEQLANAA